MLVLPVCMCTLLTETSSYRSLNWLLTPSEMLCCLSIPDCIEHFLIYKDYLSLTCYAFSFSNQSLKAIPVSKPQCCRLMKCTKFILGLFTHIMCVWDVLVCGIQMAIHVGLLVITQ